MKSGRTHITRASRPPHSTTLRRASIRRESRELRGYHIGLDEEADGVWSVFFGDFLLAKLDERDYIIRERPGTFTRCYPCPRFEVLPISPAVQTSRRASSARMPRGAAVTAAPAAKAIAMVLMKTGVFVRQKPRTIQARMMMAKMPNTVR